MKKKILLMLAACSMIGLLAGCGDDTTATDGTDVPDTTVTDQTTTDVAGTTTKKEYEIVNRKDWTAEGYTLKWEDNFDGTSLNRDDWNVELHEPGWVNEEWQEYVDSEENIQVKDGKLHIYPIKKQEADGSYSYTSGRITTQNKHDFTYGVFEVVAKVPMGKGYLPAFWLMATDENIYGQWPRCGEIDIMEVMGDKPNTLHGTAHYGNPHGQSQGTYKLSTIENFSTNFHVCAVEWEPGSIKWYVDGLLYHEENDWYSTTTGQGTLTYPAPFDQPFYMILNLAVGGSWVGYPDETTKFDNNPFVVEYVKVYQKDSYDENVTKPVEVVELRDPNADGNYINNGDFAEDEKLTDGVNWKFLLANEGNGKATIADNTMTITTEAQGTVDYSVQLVQAQIPMQKGSTYEIVFDAYASEARTFHLAVKAPDRNWVEYFPTETVEIGTEKQTYRYEFKMGNASDPNGRLEFNMGAAGSTGTIYLSNVSVRKLKDASADELNAKGILADGNHLYNGKFQEGDAHLGFWNITNTAEAEVSVTDFADSRRFKAVIPENDGAVTIAQTDLAVTTGVNYLLSFEAETDVEQEIKIRLCGRELTQTLTPGKKDYSIDVAAFTTLTDRSFAVEMTNGGTILLDDIRLVESAMIINGSFNAGFAGYE